MTAVPPLRWPAPGSRVRPLRAPAPERPARPLLRLVPEPEVARRRRLSRLFTGLAMVAVCFGLFGVVGLRVMLAQGQREVARLSAEVEQREAEQQQLRLEVAELESPTRVTSAARELGMVTPSTVVPLGPASLADPPPTTLPIPRPTTTTTTPVASTSTSVPRP
jgi:cell division protein FtsL